MRAAALSEPADRLTKRLHAGRGADRGAAISRDAVGKLAAIGQAHPADQPTQEPGEPRVAGPGRVNDVDRIGRHRKRRRTVVQITTLTIKLHADDAIRHLSAESLNHSS